MLRLTVLLVVVTLTGLPVVPAACLMWCGEHKTTSGYCQDEAVTNGSPIITAANVTCGSPVTEVPFIREEARPVLHAVHSVAPFSTAALMPAARAFVHRASGTTEVPARVALVRRL